MYIHICIDDDLQVVCPQAGAALPGHQLPDDSFAVRDELRLVRDLLPFFHKRVEKTLLGSHELAILVEVPPAALQQHRSVRGEGAGGEEENEGPHHHGCHSLDNNSTWEGLRRSEVRLEAATASLMRTRKREQTSTEEAERAEERCRHRKCAAGLLDTLS